MNSYYKNARNVITVSELDIGDEVSVISAGETGVITKKLNMTESTRIIIVNMVILQYKWDLITMMIYSDIKK